MTSCRFCVLALALLSRYRCSVSFSSPVVFTGDSSVAPPIPVSTTGEIVETSITEAAISQAALCEWSFVNGGQALRIQIGDVSTSRKAWKKRRRNASPRLIPCSVLGVNREWMVRFNIINLLNMIGEESPAADGSVAISAGKLRRAYKKKLSGDLLKHAMMMGHDSVESLIFFLFDDKIQAEYGIKVFVEQRHGNLMLSSSLTRSQARKLSNKAGLIEFRPETDEDGYLLEGSQKMIHTGLARIPSSIGKVSIHTKEPLGVALRVSPHDDTEERYQQGDEFNAFVYSYDISGDNESPLLVMTVDGTGAGITKRRIKRRQNNGEIERELKSLKAGDGPYEATVQIVSDRSSAVFVDCGVGRKKGKKFGGGMCKVLGMLRFEDMASTEVDGLKAGDKIPVYIKAVSPQSGRFMATLDPSIKNRKLKDLKREEKAIKRKERLSKQISEEVILSLIGHEYKGTIKAKSKTGDWYYVQPCMDEYRLPVGVATFTGESGGSYETGDQVMIRLDGENRGQLAFTLSHLLFD